VLPACSRNGVIEGVDPGSFAKDGVVAGGSEAVV
jgi:hypothetical protein